MYYYYGMRLRPYGPGCQPREGLVRANPHEAYFNRRRYWSVLTYDRPLTDKECYVYDLDRIEQNYYDDKE